MMRKLLGMPLALCLLALTSQAADDKKTDKDNMQGTWAMVALQTEGKTIDIPKEHQSLLIIKGDKLTMKDPDKKKDDEASFKIDEGKKHFDLIAPSDKDPKILETIQAIYSLDGDTLKLGMPEKGAKGDRPKGFDDKDIGVMVLKRVKPTEKWVASVELTEKAGKEWLVKEIKVGSKLSSNRDYLFTDLPKEIIGGSQVLRTQEEIKGWLAYSSVKAKKDGSVYAVIQTHYLGKEQFGEVSQAQLEKDGWKEVEGKVGTTFPSGEGWRWKAFKKDVKEGEVILQLDSLKWNNQIQVFFVFK